MEWILVLVVIVLWWRLGSARKRAQVAEAKVAEARAGASLAGEPPGHAIEIIDALDHAEARMRAGG